MSSSLPTHHSLPKLALVVLPQALLLVIYLLHLSHFHLSVCPLKQLRAMEPLHLFHWTCY